MMSRNERWWAIYSEVFCRLAVENGGAVLGSAVAADDPHLIYEICKKAIVAAASATEAADEAFEAEGERL